MALLETGEFESDGDQLATACPDSTRRRCGVVALVAGSAASIIWLAWRLMHLGVHPVELTFFVVELVSIAVGLIVGLAMLRAPRPRTVFEGDPRQSFRFVFAVADLVGRTRAHDLRPDLAASYRTLVRRRPTLPDAAMAAVLLDGPRRLVLVLSLTVALLLGVAPMPVPPLWAIAAGASALMMVSLSHVLLSHRRIRFGDRIRWSSSALGEFLPGADREGVAPRRWVGTVAAVVWLNLAIALRGMSDRWTHGLSPMTSDERQITMLLAFAVVIGGLYTLRTTAVPVLDNSHLVPRRTEERTARQAAVGGAVAIGVVGLMAGVLPGNVFPTADQPVPIEQISDRDVADTADVEGAAND